SVGASGPHDFAVRACAIRQERRRVHRIPHPTSVTTAKRPSDRGGTDKDIHLICISEKQKYFFERGWTTHQLRGTDRGLICPSGKSRDVFSATCRPRTSRNSWRQLLENPALGLDR